MYSSNLENELIIWDIENVLQDFVPIQYDIDSKKIKASQKLAIDLELTKFISKTDIARVVDMDEDSASDADKELLQLITPALCHFTYEKVLTYFQGSVYDAGYSTENENTASRAEAKNAAAQANSFGNQYMMAVIDFLKAENPNTDATKENKRPSVETFGGGEHWGTN
tara:strand:- start:447 stop:950 length:504 start_codon:yes stop_codon:yes gene_type:complete